MLKSAAPMRKERTRRQHASGKGKAQKKLPDVFVACLTFFEHVKRDFRDPVTAFLFHSDGDARIETVERPAEFHQTVAAMDPARYNFKKTFVFNRYRFVLECIVEIFLNSQTKVKAKLKSIAIATNGEVTMSPATYAHSHALRVGDLLTRFDVLPGLLPPEPWSS